MRLLSGEEASLFRIAMNREELACKGLDEKNRGYYARLCNRIIEKVENAVPKSALQDIMGEVMRRSFESEHIGSRIIAVDEVLNLLEGL